MEELEAMLVLDVVEGGAGAALTSVSGPPPEDAVRIQRLEERAKAAAEERQREKERVEERKRELERVWAAKRLRESDEEGGRREKERKRVEEVRVEERERDEVRRMLRRMRPGEEIVVGGRTLELVRREVDRERMMWAEVESVRAEVTRAEAARARARARIDDDDNDNDDEAPPTEIDDDIASEWLRRAEDEGKREEEEEDEEAVRRRVQEEVRRRLAGLRGHFFH